MSNSYENLSARGRKASQNGDWNALENAAQMLIESFPEKAEGYFLKALFKRAARQPNDVVENLEKALALNPNRYDAAVELAGQFSKFRRNGEARKILDGVSGALTNSPRYLDMAGTIYIEIGMPEKAWPLYERAYELQPDVDIFQANLASCAVYMGEFEKAKSLYKALIKRNPTHRGNHFHFSRVLKAKDRVHIDQMKQLLEDKSVSNDRNIPILFGIGKELADIKAWDESFEYYERANKAVSSVINYDIAPDLHLLRDLETQFSKDWYQEVIKSQRSQSPASQKTPIFITGLPRTGSTLLERILLNNPEVSSLGETVFIQSAIRKANGGIARQNIMANEVKAASDDLASFSQDYMEAVSYRLAPEPYFIEKLPMNFLYIGLIAAAWPDAKIIVTRKNAMDSCFSLYKQVFTWAYKYSYDFETLTQYYQAYLQLLDHWREVLGGRLIEVEYEALVRNPKAEAQALFNALNLPFKEEYVDVENQSRPSTTASSVQVRSKINAKAINQWKHYETALAGLEKKLNESGIKTREL